MEVDGQVLGSGFSARIGERLGKTIHNGQFSTLPQPCYGTRQIVEAKFRASLPCLGDSGAISIFRAWQERNLLAYQPDFRWWFRTTKRYTHYIEMA